MTQFMRASSWRRNDLVRTAGSAAVGDSAIAAGVGRVLQESVSMLTATMVQVNLAAAVRHLRPGRAHRDGAHESHWLVGSPYQGRRLHPAAKGSTAWRCATTCPTARSSLTAQLITSSTPPQVRQLHPPSAAATPPGRRRYRRRPRTTSRGQPPIASPVAAGQVLPPAASFSWACSRSPACQYWRKRVAEKQEEGGSHQTG